MATFNYTQNTTHTTEIRIDTFEPNQIQELEFIKNELETRGYEFIDLITIAHSKSLVVLSIKRM